MIRARLHYNKLGISDTLILVCKDEAYKSYDVRNDVIVIYNDKKDVIGVNFTNASKYFDSLVDGGYFEDKKTLERCNELLKKEGFDELVFDTDNYFYVGKVISCEDHPDSDHLHVCKVDVGDEILDIVCGASNCRKDLKVVVAKIKAIMPNGKLIVPSKLRNIPSNGMLCSAKELQIDYDQVGILELNEKYQVGTKFEWKGL